MKRICSEEYINDELDFLLQVNIKKDALSRRESSNRCHVSFDITNHADLWEVTIVPSILSETISSNDATASSATFLNTIKKHDGNKLNLHLSDGNKRENEQTYGRKYTWRDERSKIASPIYQRSNHDNTDCSFNSDKRISASRANEKKPDDRTDERISEKRSMKQPQVCTDSKNESSALFIELGAIHKILDFITDSDPKISSLTSSCCKEISRTLQCLVAQYREKNLEDLLLNDSSLYRCERCGVINDILGSRSIIEEVKENGRRIARNIEIMAAERENANDDDRNNKEIVISGSPADPKDNMQSRTLVDNVEVDRAKYKGELNGTKSLPIKERTFITRKRAERLSDASDIPRTEHTSKIKDTSRQNNSAIQKLFMKFEAAKQHRKYEFDSATRNHPPYKDDLLTAMKIYDTDQEEIVRKVSYENKSRIDDLPVPERFSERARKTQRLQKSFEENNNIYALIDTVKYLARGGQSAILAKDENDILSKLQEGRIPVEDTGKKKSFALYGSRDDCPQCDSGFWLFDKSGNLPRVSLDKPHYLPIPDLGNNGDNLHASIPRYLNMKKNRTEKIISRTECMEKDSLESYAKLESRRESDTTTLVSSSSAESLMHEWMTSLYKKDYINDVDKNIRHSHKLVLSKPSLDIARHVRAEIAKDRCSDNAKKSTRDPRASCDSNILAELSPETRRKICHLIQKIVLSDPVKDPIFHDEKLATSVLNSEKSHSKSTDATFIRPDKLGEITNTLMDYIPTKLSQLSKDSDRFLKRQDNPVDNCSQNLDESNNHAKISRECSHVPSDNLEKIGSAGDSSEKIVRRIIYKDVSSRNIIDNNAMTEILSVYRKILDNSESLDWDSFREMIEILHPRQKGLWRDICRTINKETTRVASDANDSTEVWIEISPVTPEETLRTGKVAAYAREIVFELDMTLEDIESFLNGGPHLLHAEECLDTYKDRR